MYQTFIGIDMGKNHFYVSIHQQNEIQRFTNNAQGFEAFYSNNQQTLNQGLVIVETTGGYEKAFIHYLLEKNCAVHRANTRKVKHFIRSYGQLGKSDAIDAKGLARYGYERRHTLPLFINHERASLLKLVARRDDLKQMLIQEKNRLKAPDQESLQASFNKIIKVLEQELQSIDQKIHALVQQDKTLIQHKELIKTIPGIGEITAIQLLALLPELGRLNRKQIASLSGLAPHPNESGQKIGYRFTRGGRRPVKPVLFMAAMTAARSQSQLGQFYQKLITAGKKKMVALTALMRKIIVIANAKIRDLLLNHSPIQHS